MDLAKFTLLEKSILDWISEKYPDPALRSQINKAIVTKREYTGVGWFVDLEIPEPRMLLDSKLISPINGPYIRSPQIEHDGGSILFHENGIIKLLELYANGDRFDKELSQYELFGDEDSPHFA